MNLTTHTYTYARLYHITFVRIFEMFDIYQRKMLDLVL